MILMSAVLGLAAMSANAETYSSNVVGYVNLTIGTGYNLIANPLSNGDNMLKTVLPKLSLPSAETEITAMQYTGTGFFSAVYFDGEWDENFSLAPGEGIFLYNPGEAFTTTFVGEVTVGEHSTDIPAGFSVVSNLIPQANTLSELKLPLAGESGEDYVMFWDATKGTYSAAIPYFEGEWESNPSVAVGEAFFLYNSGAAAKWTRSFDM